MKATILHNPACGTSRKTLDILEADGAEIALEPAGHAFLNHLGPWYDEDAAGRAWDATTVFLSRTLPV